MTQERQVYLEQINTVTIALQATGAGGRVGFISMVNALMAHSDSRELDIHMEEGRYRLHAALIGEIDELSSLLDLVGE